MAVVLHLDDVRQVAEIEKQLAEHTVDLLSTSSKQVALVHELGKALQDKAKVVAEWAARAADSVDEAESKVYQDITVCLRTVTMAHTKAGLHRFKVATHFQMLTHTVDDLLMKILRNYSLPGAPDGLSGAVLDTWDPAVVTSDLKALRGLVEEFSRLSLPPAEGMLNALESFLEARQRMYAVDVDKDAKAAWKQILASRERKAEIALKMAEDEMKLKVEEAQLRELVRAAQQKQSLLSRFQEFGKALESQHATLQAQVCKNTTELATKFAQLKEQEEDRFEKMKASLDAESVAHESKGLETLTEYEDKARAMSMRIINEQNIVGNHFIFVLDNSLSMLGPRWTAALSSMQAFVDVRVAEGGQDRISVVAFNHEAQQVITNQALAMDVAEAVRAATRVMVGGTSFKAGWQEAAQCAAFTRPELRVMVVFITDGKSGATDIAAAAEIAAKMHAEQSRQGGMTAFVVNVDMRIKDEVLEPLVKAGNGGKTVENILGDTTPLLVNVKAIDMLQRFKRMASLASINRAAMQSCVRLAKLAAVEERHAQQKRRRDLEATHAARIEKFEAAACKARQARSKSAAEAKALLAELIKNSEEELRQVQAQITLASEELKDAEGKRDSKQEAVTALEKARSDENDAGVIADCKESEKLAADALKKVSQIQGKLMSKFGTTDPDILAGWLADLHEMERLCQEAVWRREQEEGMMYYFRTFLGKLIADIESPLAKVPVKEKMDSALKALLRERGLQTAGDPLTCLRAYLQYEADRLGSEFKTAPEKMLQSIDSPHILCGAVGLKDEDDVADEKGRVINLVLEGAWEVHGVGASLATQVDELKAELEGLETDLETKMEELQKEVDMFEVEPGGNQTADALREECKQLKARLKEKKAAHRTAESTLKDGRRKIREEMKSVVRLTKVVMEQFKKAYDKETNQLVLQNICFYGRSYQERLRAPMQTFVKGAEAMLRATSVAPLTLQ